MKVFNKIMTGSAIATVIFLAACEKDRGKEVAQENYNYSNSALMQVYNGVLQSSRNYVYMDAQPLNGATIAYNTVFPGGTAPVSFAIGSGFREFLIRDTLVTSTQPMMTLGEDIQAGRNYTLFNYDTFTSPKNKLVVNNIVVPSDSTARIRFANFIYNPGALATGFDIYSAKRQAVVFSNVKESEVTDYIPYASGVADTFYLRLNGSTTNFQNLDTLGKTTMVNVFAVLNPTQKRSYTLVFRGGYRTYYNKAGTSPFGAIAYARGLTFFANY